MAVLKAKSIDEFVRDAVLDCHATIPVAASVNVTCMPTGNFPDGTRTFSLKAEYSVDTVLRVSYSGTISLDRGDVLPDYAKIMGQMIGRFGIQAGIEKLRGFYARKIELDTDSLRRFMSAGVVADMLGVATSRVVDAYYRNYKREPAGNCFGFPDVVRIAGQLGLSDEQLLKRLEAYHKA